MQAQVLRTGDVRSMLSAIACPTLVINHADVDDGRFLAEHIPDACYLELLDPCHLMFSPELEGVMAVANEIINVSPVEPARYRVLTTLLFTDIVDSTSTWPRSATAGGDRAGRALRHGPPAHRPVRRHRDQDDG